jgi:hypothetical protein
MASGHPCRLPSKNKAQGEALQLTFGNLHWLSVML